MKHHNATGSYYNGRIVNKEFNMPTGRCNIPGNQEYNEVIIIHSDQQGEAL